MGKNSARSISGNCCIRPERGGHSSSKVFETATKSAGQSPSNAQACTSLPPFCVTVPSPSQFAAVARIPSSSSNSIRARGNNSSPSAASPFGIVHAPSSLLRKYGPPGCASRTSNPFWRFSKHQQTCAGSRSFHDKANGRLTCCVAQYLMPLMSRYLLIPYRFRIAGIFFILAFLTSGAQARKKRSGVYHLGE